MKKLILTIGLGVSVLLGNDNIIDNITVKKDIYENIEKNGGLNEMYKKAKLKDKKIQIGQIITGARNENGEPTVDNWDGRLITFAKRNLNVSIEKEKDLLGDFKTKLSQCGINSTMVDNNFNLSTGTYNGDIDCSNRGLTNINEFVVLKNMNGALNINNNSIKNLKGLENLENIVFLFANDNLIEDTSDIKDTLKSAMFISLMNNPLEEDFILNADIIGTLMLVNNTTVKTVSLPNITNINDLSVGGLPNLEIVSADNLISANHYNISYCPKLKNIHSNNLIEIGFIGLIVKENPLLENLSVSSLETIQGQTELINVPNLDFTNIFNNVSTINNTIFILDTDTTIKLNGFVCSLHNSMYYGVYDNLYKTKIELCN